MEKSDEFIDRLKEAQVSLRNRSYQKYSRVNPFVEDLTDWKERGAFLFGEGKNITVYNTATILGDVQVGENTWIGPYTAIDGSAGVKIGSFCSISSGVQIVSHDSVKWALSGGKAKYEYGAIEIGDCCFIGTHAMITKGVKIGNHCLIGANAIVTSDIPDNSIALGIPAKVVGTVVVEGESVTLNYFK
jgi:acetyltransferase-like isoleucine patch superfamily enzyme